MFYCTGTYIRCTTSQNGSSESADLDFWCGLLTFQDFFYFEWQLDENIQLYVLIIWQELANGQDFVKNLRKKVLEGFISFIDLSY